MEKAERDKIFIEENKLGWNFECMVVNLHIKNTSPTIETVYAVYFRIEGLFFDNGNDLSALIKMNDEDIVQTITLKPGEEYDIVIPFIISDAIIDKKDWDNRKESDFNLVINLYPNKQIINLA